MRRRAGRRPGGDARTLGYRIRKIEQLTGRGLATTQDLAEWWFALRAHDLLTGGHLR